MRNALAVAWKELQLLWKDKGELVVLFLMPIMFASIIASAFGGSGTPGIHVYLVNQDTGPYGRQIEETLSGISALRLEKLTPLSRLMPWWPTARRSRRW
jgi:hypothetical protein